MTHRRYILGVDLGTTNTAVAFVDTESAHGRVEVFDVPQLVAPGELADRRQLPSFVYLASGRDLAPAETALPWDPDATRVVGELARAQGARVPGRMIASAKSWLCHAGVDREAPILPWGQPGDAKLSPVHASALVLAHVRHAWEHVHHAAAASHARRPPAGQTGADAGDAGAPAFGDAEVIVTVPASFDEAARELTLAAAERAGYGPIVLLEEPQAAFYAWIDSRPARARADALRPGDQVLVFDVGGGTTDFTLIAVGDDDELSRTAVGDHLLLGGDNIDLTLARQVEAKLLRLLAGKSSRLDPVQWHGLVHACRLAKETLLAGDDRDAVPITVAGRGSRLIGGTLKAEVRRDELLETICGGFFPACGRDDGPRRARGGLQEFGLPYAADPGITRHLAAFLSRHGAARVDAVLFNGGAMAPAVLRRRVIDQIAAWQGDAPRELSNQLPELAVARGAAYYGLVRRGMGARIRGGTPRSFYVGVGAARGRHGAARGQEDPGAGAAGGRGDAGAAGGAAEMAVCLAPKGLEDGSAVELDRTFALVTNRPVSFKLFSSSTREDRPGDLVPARERGRASERERINNGDGEPDMTDDDSERGRASERERNDNNDLLELPPIVTVLRARGRSQVDVRLRVVITELGALEIWCTERRDGDGDGEPERWRLAFDMRAGGAARPDDHGSDAGVTGELPPEVREGAEHIKRAFAGPAQELASIMKQLEDVLGARRDEWPLSATRALFDAALEVERERARSPGHEQRWLNVAAFCLRPGSGAPLDTWRARQMWRVFNEGLAHPKVEACRLAWWIAWRRIAGGLSAGQQEQIFDRLAQLFLPGAKQKKKWYQVKPTRQEAAEMWRTLANLERLPPEHKVALGDELVSRLEATKGQKASQKGGQSDEALWAWALGRIGSRVPLYGPLNAVVEAARVERWIEAVLAVDLPDREKAAFPMAQLGRRTGDRARDIGDEARAALARWLRAIPGGERSARLVEEVVALEAREERVALGDTLPAGLRLVSDDDRPPAGGDGEGVAGAADMADGDGG